MLQLLKVANFALIEQAEIEFSGGFNVLTGETGAGKSIVVDALSVALGGRASVDMVRSGSEGFRVEVVFELPAQSPVAELLRSQDIDLEEDGQLLISRSVTRQGKNTVLMNGRHMPLSVLRQAGDMLLDMHGQHENQALLRPEFHIELLDASAAEVHAAADEYRQAYEAWRQTAKKLAAVDQDARQRAQRADMLRWQADEIAAAKLKADEDAELSRQISLLTHAEKLSVAVGAAWTTLDGGDGRVKGVLDSLQECRRQLEGAVRFDEALAVWVDQLTEALTPLSDVSAGLRDYLERIEYDPAKLARLQERMDLIYRLKQKYGASVDEVIAYGREAAKELGELDHHAETLQELRQQLSRQEAALGKLADSLHERRLRAAAGMETGIGEQLRDLGMPGGRFAVKVLKQEQFAPNGRDTVLLEFSANPGEELRPLVKVASGGELSRVALALKTVCARKDDVDVMVFDEIDAGVGGSTARKVAEKIAWLSRQRQILCITHLPQIACMADRHIHIEKETVGERTRTLVQVLAEPERLDELARMIGGEPITRAGLDNAADLIKTAETMKNEWRKTNGQKI